MANGPLYNKKLQEIRETLKSKNIPIPKEDSIEKESDQLRVLIDEFNNQMDLFILNLESCKNKTSSSDVVKSEKEKKYQLFISQLQMALHESNSKSEQSMEKLLSLNKDSDKKITEYQNEIKDLKMKLENSVFNLIFDKHQQVKITL